VLLYGNRNFEDIPRETSQRSSFIVLDVASNYMYVVKQGKKGKSNKGIFLFVVCSNMQRYSGLLESNYNVMKRSQSLEIVFRDICSVFYEELETVEISMLTGDHDRRLAAIGMGPIDVEGRRGGAVVLRKNGLESCQTAASGEFPEIDLFVILKSTKQFLYFYHTPKHLLSMQRDLH
jgi:hypothetical protein